MLSAYTAPTHVVVEAKRGHAHTRQDLLIGPCIEPILAYEHIGKDSLLRGFMVVVRPLLLALFLLHVACPALGGVVIPGIQSERG